MFHAFLRYIFGILPLFLAMVPADSSASMNDLLQKYDTYLFRHIQSLVKKTEQYPECKRFNTSRVFFNRTEVNITGLEVFCNSTLRRDIHTMACYLQKMIKRRCNFTESIVGDVEQVSEITLAMLKACNNNTGEKRQKENPCQNVKNAKRLCHQCLIKHIASEFSSCWTQVRWR